MKSTDILPLVEAKKWVRIDYEDEDSAILDLINLAYVLIADSVDNFEVKVLNESFKIKLKYCMSCSITDMYDNRASTTDKKEQLKLINQNALLQLKCGVYE
ncbi:phage gp6-like head-tail connector protein [Clostridium gasigenes]|uniref:head-tail connector protein n=1 Tax=Clostridium gasigenes TaxID=94869 RepID=UPI001627809F|nr:head-tail connector protein [Clostridium gasigenes]MBB6622168.1 phage gp6-like head-tail connector protein [Clostridium gasigenes]